MPSPGRLKGRTSLGTGSTSGYVVRAPEPLTNRNGLIGPVLRIGCRRVVACSWSRRHYRGDERQGVVVVSPGKPDVQHRGARQTFLPRTDTIAAGILAMGTQKDLKGKTVKVFFLIGVQKPYLEEKSGWAVDGVEFKVRIDAAA